MTGTILSDDNIEYIADALHIINKFKQTASAVTPQTLKELDELLRPAEAALRRMAAEMRLPLVPKTTDPN